MKLDRNINGDGKGKYALVKLRDLPTRPRTPMELAAAIILHPECVDFGEAGSDSEFFVIRLKDRYAREALMAYADEAARVGNRQWAAEVYALAGRAGPLNPHCKEPD